MQTTDVELHHFITPPHNRIGTRSLTPRGSLRAAHQQSRQSPRRPLPQLCLVPRATRYSFLSPPPLNGDPRRCPQLALHLGGDYGNCGKCDPKLLRPLVSGWTWRERERGNQFDKYANISFTQIRCANCFIGTYYATTTVNHLCPMAEI